jgi:hypothetical protein
MNKQASNDIKTCITTFNQPTQAYLKDWCDRTTNTSTYCSITNSDNDNPCKLKVYIPGNIPDPDLPDWMKLVTFLITDNGKGCLATNDILTVNQFPDQTIKELYCGVVKK